MDRARKLAAFVWTWLSNHTNPPSAEQVDAALGVRPSPSELGAALERVQRGRARLDRHVDEAAARVHATRRGGA